MKYKKYQRIVNLSDRESLDAHQEFVINNPTIFIHKVMQRGNWAVFEWVE